MSGEHTATPWMLDTLPTRITNGKRGFSGHYRLADAYFTDALVNTPRHDKAVANAAHIVRCVNAFDTLVSALLMSRAVHQDLADSYEPSSTEHGLAVSAIKTIDAALAKLDATP